MFIFLNEASIYTILHVAFNLVDFVLWGGVQTPSHHRPFKLWFEFEVHLDQLFARQGWEQRSKSLLVFLDYLSGTRVKLHALQFLRNDLLSMEVALPLFWFLHMPHSFRGEFSLPVLAALLAIVKGVYQGYLRIGDSHFLNILLRPHRRFPGPLEEVQAGQLPDTLSLCPQNLLEIMYVVPRDGHIVR